MEQFYNSFLNKIHSNNSLKTIIIFISKYLPYIPFLLYPCILLYLFITHNSLLLSTLLRPLSAFIFVTVLRKIINRKRPYESMNIQPLIQHKSGESFPSRHALSAMIIALVCIDINIYLGIIMFILAIVICLSRIIAGVHYISDVIVAVIIAVIFYIL